MFLGLDFQPPPPEYRWWHLERPAPEPITRFTATGETQRKGDANVSVSRGDSPDARIAGDRPRLQRMGLD